MNNVNIIGNLTKDVELKYTQDDKAVTTVSLAVNEGYGDKQKTYYVDVQVWDNKAVNLAKYCGKGSKVAISGKLIQQRWEHEGKNHSKVLIQAFNIAFLNTKKETQTVELSQGKIITKAVNEESNPFQDFAEEQQEIELSDLDLPF